MQTYRFPLFAIALATTASAQTRVVVPAGFTAIDALSYEWIAGATDPLRQVTLVGSSHLQAVVGRNIQALELRRTAVPEAYQAGSMTLTVSLSISPLAPVSASNVFAANVGPNPIQVFQGVVTMPASPAVGPPQSAVGWTPNNIVRIPFSTPFFYQGGTLCIDVVGLPIQGQQTWWMADAAEEVVPGSQAVEISPGCGIYGGPQHQWSEVHVRTLVPGGQGVFRAEGTPNGIGLAIFGTPAAAPIPLSLIGLPSPGCVCAIDPSSIVTSLAAVFEPEVHPLLAGLATAEVLLAVPANSAVFGFQLTTQWLDLAQLATSNAISWTIASSIPSLDMALVEGDPSEAIGSMTNYLAHVLRFELQ